MNWMKLHLLVLSVCWVLAESVLTAYMNIWHILLDWLLLARQQSGKILQFCENLFGAKKFVLRPGSLVLPPFHSLTSLLPYISCNTIINLIESKAPARSQDWMPGHCKNLSLNYGLFICPFFGSVQLALGLIPHPTRWHWPACGLCNKLLPISCPGFRVASFWGEKVHHNDRYPVPARRREGHWGRDIAWRWPCLSFLGSRPSTPAQGLAVLSFFRAEGRWLHCLGKLATITDGDKEMQEQKYFFKKDSSEG